MNRLTNNLGIGLISVIVAIAILATATTAAVSVFFSAARLTRLAADFTMASNFAEGVMERVTADPFDDIAAKETTAGLPVLSDAKCLLDVKPAGDGLKEVTVTCSWNEGETRYHITFSTLVARGGAR